MKYFEESKLKHYLDIFSQNNDPDQKVMYDIEDLVHIHKLVRKRKPFTTLEFGVGYSTVTICHALKLNKEEYDSLPSKPKLRNSKLFKHYSVDSDQFWIENTKSNFPSDLKEFVNFNYSKVYATTINNLQLCSLYKNIPDIVPDFIYLDGPNPKDVQGNVNGLSFKCNERTVMSGDLLLMESTLIPGAYILIDGRTNNANFLRNNFKRNYSFNWDKKGDRSSFELIEERLGKYNILGSDIY
tara:strand:+ start:11077 stop:11799 length:723 start_codon:yes stop_codon:yes gene_type:complete